MLDILNNSEHKEIPTIQKKIISGFNDILNMLRTNLGANGNVISLERGIITPDGNSIYRNYFEETHSKMKEKLGEYYSFSVTKINLSYGNSIVLSTNSQPELEGKGIIFLDKIKERLGLSQRTILDDKMRNIHYMEREVFNRNRVVSSDTSKEIFENIA